MVLELSTGGSVQDMLEDPAKAPGGQLPMATVRPVRQITCFDQAFIVLLEILVQHSALADKVDRSQCN